MTKKPPLTLVGSTVTGSTSPATLGEHGQAMWEGVMGGYRIDDIGGRAILEQICCAKDRIEALAAQIAVDGPVIYVKGVPRSHPGLKEELGLRAFICRNLQRLGLNLETVRPLGRPPSGGWSGSGS